MKVHVFGHDEVMVSVRRDSNKRLRYVIGVTSKSPSENVGSTINIQN